MKHNLRKQIIGLSLPALALFILSGCGESKFKVKGEIYGADHQSVVLEKSDFNGRWIEVDSTKTSGQGSFSISWPAPVAPEIFRLRLSDNYIYFPVDSTETITVTSSLDKFGSEYELQGSAKAADMARFDKELLSISANTPRDSMASFKKKVYTEYLHDAAGSIVSYYILTKTLPDGPLFDPADPIDYKYFAAVATGFKSSRPNDPRTSLLEQTTLTALKNRNSNLGKYRAIEAEEVTFFDIELPDENGKIKKLSDMVGKGKKTVLIFSLLSDPNSPSMNFELSEILKKNGDTVDFYNVSVDPDQYAWRDAASNLPWTTVFDSDREYSTVLQTYNVTTFPLFYIYDASGDLTERATSVNELRKKL